MEEAAVHWKRLRRIKKGPRENEAKMQAVRKWKIFRTEWHTAEVGQRGGIIRNKKAEGANVNGRLENGKDDRWMRQITKIADKADRTVEMCDRSHESVKKERGDR